jgi:hypothetical protein
MDMLGFTFSWLPLFWLLRFAAPTVELDGDAKGRRDLFLGMKSGLRKATILLLSKLKIFHHCCTGHSHFPFVKIPKYCNPIFATTGAK